ncbi:hypothetical protein CA51_06640 [Rosistilla oblonga]|uniref:hypothetical protein n=1 Tax=Rosistilla oblonga TaxID=2527990 RepID=UPI00118B5118|nr:hypothetical protein [Rosistilla oblonga]QDV10810.1 hypothetical protein CA51_06640 [Rosistilla oblonga]
MKLKSYLFATVVVGFCLGTNSLQAAFPFFESLEVRSGAIGLDRHDDREGMILRDNPVKSVLDRSELNLGSSAGWELSLLGHLNEKHAVEVRYFEINDFDFKTTREGIGGIGFPVTPGGVGIFGATSTADVNYTSGMSNVEVGGRWSFHEDIQLLYGIRHIRHREQLNGFVVPYGFVDTTDVTFRADNQLTGFQLGLDSLLYEFGRFRLEGLVKAGIFNNHAKTSYRAIGTGPFLGSLNESATDRDDVAAFAGEAQLTAAVAITDWLSIRASYQFLALTNLATADDQILGTDRSGPVTTATNTGECPIYQGLSLMAEVRLF